MIIIRFYEKRIKNEKVNSFFNQAGVAAIEPTLRRTLVHFIQHSAKEKTTAVRH